MNDKTDHLVLWDVIHKPEDEGGLLGGGDIGHGEWNKKPVLNQNKLTVFGTIHVGIDAKGKVKDKAVALGIKVLDETL